MLLTKSVINIAMEATASCFLLLLLVVCLLQKKKDGTMRSLTAVVLTELLCLLCQIGQWSVLRQLTVGNTAVLPFGKTLFAADFALVCLLSAFFRMYILAHRENLREEAGLARESHRRELKCLFLWWITVSAVFASSIWTGIFYTFSETEYGIPKPLYGLIFAIGLLPAVLNIITTIKNRKLFGTKDACFLLAFTLVPSVGVAFDLLSDLCISYLLSALIIVMLFIGINVHHNETVLQREAELAKSHEEMTNMRVKLMMAQIQPHFLYNTLSSIAYLCTEDPKEAENATNEFASYLKSNLKSINSRKPIPFVEELRHVENYLKIEKRRFTDRIKIVYDIETTDFNIPALALQTMVENAVRYGAEARYEPTTITVSTNETDTVFVVTVQDDGVGFDVSHTPEEDRLHIGIEGTRSRLASMVGGTLEIDSKIGIGTTVTMTIPKENGGETV
ncbi:MAG: histidine kinase [Eubacteriales bacterium]|nr:histidine kinase [Eubacteriales bacterium]